MVLKLFGRCHTQVKFYSFTPAGCFLHSKESCHRIWMILGLFFRNDRLNNDVIIFRNMIIRTSNYLFIFNKLYVKFDQIQCTNTFPANYIHLIIYIYTVCTCISSFNFVTRKKIKRTHRHKRIELILDFSLWAMMIGKQIKLLQSKQ